MRRNRCTQTAGAMGILLSLRSNYLGWREPVRNLFLEPTFPAVYSFTVSTPFCRKAWEKLVEDWTECPNFFQTQEHCQVRRGPRGSRLGHLRRFLCVRYVYYYVAVVPVGQKLLP